MRSIKFIVLTTFALSIFIGTAVGQTSSLDAQEEDQNLATIYVYRRDEGVTAGNFFFWFRKTRPVYFREKLDVAPAQKNRKIASLRNKQYFVMRLPKGKYIFDTRLSDNLELDVVSGGEYYLWVDQGNDCPEEDGYMIGPPSCASSSAAVVPVSAERWKRDLRVLKPIKRGDVKDRKLVIIPANKST